MRAAPLLLLGLASLGACGDKALDDTGLAGQAVTAVWLEEASYEWEYFNHRVSHLTFQVEEAGLSVAVIGGTSTTGVNPELPEGCDADTCEEFPFKDSALVDLRWARLETEEAAVGTGSIEILADAAGYTDTLELVLEGSAGGGGNTAAVLQGFSLDTDHPLTGGEACYDPALGWHLRSLSVELGEPELTAEGTLLVDVSVAASAGASVEEVRECVDAVTDQAQIPVTVHVLGLATAADVESELVAHGMAYEYEDEEGELVEQPDPDLAERPLGLDQGLVGWSALSFAFHVDDPDDRGAYIRRLSVAHDVDAGWASGHANNYSPPTQLSGFDYEFEGRLTGVDLSGSPERGSFSDTLPAELDDQGDPVVTIAPLQ